MNKKYKVIYGPPGTGKSTYVIKSVQDFIAKGVPTEKIGLCSFTKAASQVLSEKAGFKSRFIGTVHSIAFKQAGILFSQVVNYTALKEFEQITGIEFTGCNPEDSDKDLTDGDYYMNLYSLSRSRLDKSYEHTYNDSKMPGTREGFTFFCTMYDKWKKERGYIDYNDMLTRALTAPAPQLDVLIVDEAQDLSALQWSLIEHWVVGIEHVIIAGDDDQSIYVWGGASPKSVTEFELKHSCERVVLSQSYRIPRVIHKLAHEIISVVDSRVDKLYKPRESEGVIVKHAGITSLELPEDGDNVLVLYRNHSLRDMLENELISNGIIYKVDNGKPGLLESWHMKNLRVFIRLRNSPDRECVELKKSEMDNLKRSLTSYFRSRFEAGDMTVFDVSWKIALNIPERVESYFSLVLNKYPNLEYKQNIHLSTIHGAKGKEADRVILINGVGAMTHESFNENMDSEARVFYVGVTRAKERLDIVDTDNCLDWLL